MKRKGKERELKKIVLFLVLAMVLFLAMPVAASPPGDVALGLVRDEVVVIADAKAITVAGSESRAIVPENGVIAITTAFTFDVLFQRLITIAGLVLVSFLLGKIMLAGSMRKTKIFRYGLDLVQYDPRNREHGLARDQTVTV
jgi:hypothetical protein